MSRLARALLNIGAPLFRCLSLARLAMTAVLVLFLFSFPIAAGQQARDLRGSPKDPLKETPGKAVVLVFVRTDCPISNRYAPLLREMSVKYGSAAAFWLVFPDKNESPESIRSYLREFSYKLPALRDPEHSLVKKSGAKVTPEAAVFNWKPLRRALAVSFPTSNDAFCTSSWREHVLLFSGNCSGLRESFGSQTTGPESCSESASHF